MSTDRISIALATYNGDRHLRAQLESFAAQTRLPDELVACDDGSTDGTVEILERFANEAPFAVVIHRNPHNLGYVKNFEKALSLCSGNIIFLSDQDDAWFAEKIEHVAAAFVGRPDLMVVLNDQVIADAHLVPTRATQLTNIRRYGAPDRRFVTGCCSAHRKEWHSVVLPIPAAGDTHDRWINEAAHRLQTSLIIEMPLQYYRRHGENISNSPFSSGRRVGPLNRLAKNLGLTRSRPSGVRNEDWERCLMERLAERRGALAGLGLGRAAEAACVQILAARRLLADRRQIWMLPRLSRLGPIARLWRSNAYGAASGWRSAIGDFVRSPARR